MNGAQNALTLEIYSLVCLSISFRVKFLENDKMYYFAFRERVAENKNNVYKKSRKIISIALLSKY